MNNANLLLFRFQSASLLYEFWERRVRNKLWFSIELTLFDLECQNGAPGANAVSIPSGNKLEMGPLSENIYMEQSL